MFPDKLGNEKSGAGYLDELAATASGVDTSVTEVVVVTNKTAANNILLGMNFKRECMGLSVTVKGEVIKNDSYDRILCDRNI